LCYYDCFYINVLEHQRFPKFQFSALLVACVSPMLTAAAVSPAGALRES
jgi:hypothetical protein